MAKKDFRATNRIDPLNELLRRAASFCGFTLSKAHDLPQVLTAIWQLEIFSDVAQQRIFLMTNFKVFLFDAVIEGL